MNCCASLTLLSKESLEQRPGSLQATRGPGADEVQLRLEVYEGGPEAGEAIAAAGDGR